MAEKPDPQDALLPLLKLRPLLKHAEAGPVGCALGLTKDKAALLLLDKVAKPKALRERMKAEAGTALEANSLRFGWVRIDAAADPGTVCFVLNKAEAGGTAAAVLRIIRKSGYQSVVFNPDPTLEGEGAAPPAAHDTAALRASLAALIRRIPAADPGLKPGLVALATEAQASLKREALTEAASAIAALGRALDAAANTHGAPAPVPPAAPEAGEAALTATLTALVRRIGEVIARDPSLKDGLVERATQARLDLKAGRLAAARAGIAALQQALDASAAAASRAAGRSGSAPLLALWRRTREALDRQVASLQRALRAYADPDLRDIAEYGFNAFTGGSNTRLMAALFEYDGTPSPAAAEAVRAALASYETLLQPGSVLEDYDDNPLGVAVQFRATLRTGLSGLRAELDRVAA
jgi:hypothetical protein